MAFEGHICGWHLYAYSMISKVGVHCFLMWSLHVDLITSALGNTLSDVVGIYVQGHMPIFGNLHRPVLVVKSLTALSSYELYILKQLYGIYT